MIRLEFGARFMFFLRFILLVIGLILSLSLEKNIIYWVLTIFQEQSNGLKYVIYFLRKACVRYYSYYLEGETEN